MVISWGQGVSRQKMIKGNKDRIAGGGSLPLCCCSGGLTQRLIEGLTGGGVSWRSDCCCRQQEVSALWWPHWVLTAMFPMLVLMVLPGEHPIGSSRPQGKERYTTLWRGTGAFTGGNMTSPHIALYRCAEDDINQIKTNSSDFWTSDKVSI